MGFKINKKKYYQDDVYSVVNDELKAINAIQLLLNNTTQVEIPAGIKTIDNRLVFPSTAKTFKANQELNYVPHDFFLNSKNVEGIDLYDSNTQSVDIIGAGNLTKLILPKKIKILNAGRLAGSYRLTYIWVPSTIQYIDKHSFNTCIKLKEIKTDNKEELLRVMSQTFTPAALSKFQIVEVSEIERL